MITNCYEPPGGEGEDGEGYHAEDKQDNIEYNYDYELVVASHPNVCQP